jgi:hypothetical protein
MGEARLRLFDQFGVGLNRNNAKAEREVISSIIAIIHANVVYEVVDWHTEDPLLLRARWHPALLPRGIGIANQVVMARIVPQHLESSLWRRTSRKSAPRGLVQTAEGIDTLATPRITVGLPVYRGADLVPKALECLQRQTFDNFEAIISVDGNDQETADACRSFLTDPRFRMVVHRERLDWVGNFNWLLQQDLKDFFCYRQHDDTTAPEFFEVLLRVADKELHAAAIYSDCQMIGGRNDVESFPSITGETLDRMFQFVIRLPNLGPPVPIRGLMRRAAIRQAGLCEVRRISCSVAGLWLACRSLAMGRF